VTAMQDRSRVWEYFSWSHWGLFIEPLFTAPDWFVMGLDLDDEQIEEL
jgi:hypothetical protein